MSLSKRMLPCIAFQDAVALSLWEAGKGWRAGAPPSPEIGTPCECWVISCDSCRRERVDVTATNGNRLCLVATAPAADDDHWMLALLDYPRDMSVYVIDKRYDYCPRCVPEVVKRLSAFNHEVYFRSGR